MQNYPPGYPQQPGYPPQPGQGYPQQPGYPPSPGYPGAPQQPYGAYSQALQYGGFWRRLLAVFIDGIILGVVVQIINGIIAAASGGMINDGAGYLRGSVFELILGIIYFGYMWSQYGKSLGYMALGIRLVREDGAPVSFGLAAGRWALIWLSLQLCGIPALVSAFMIGLGQQKKGIHDYIVRTLVVQG